MADFVNQFWSWFIAIPTVLGILACAWLVLGNMSGKGSGSGSETTGHIWDVDLTEYNNPLPAWWLNLFLITIVWGLIYLVLYPGLGSFAGTLAWTSAERYEIEMAQAEDEYAPLFARYQKTDLALLAKDKVAMRTAERLFASYCSTCHGSDARGAVGFPNLRDGIWSWGGDPKQIKSTILDGRIGIMPGWATPLGGTQGVDDVTEYVLSLSGQEVNADQLLSGQEKFQTFCIGCHGVDGTGNPAVGAPNLTDMTWLYGGSRESIHRSIAVGRRGQMPGHQSFLGEHKVHLLAAYIVSLNP
ncbi:MAG: cytochrome-c oxidase, cbb3-type subunit III [Proteobacteria bacterium]|jgi:cytochrome c oxidase cbb3-type subunit III|nr:cytochrome-c oxidase, cbb3-type subunit III [Pseudomonadota bacterium]MBT5189839.1 cytochrome-c oxidase, cbb3-type subunit III [Pseudomonadota bacterium]MBT6658154.1 cytochrome-c oxidase, cbb3-type subunit III [Pseudomonadota bacterium]MBT6932833.1 cytochrome-c oxidase, cbb3-type subunit III [Pseudomonadota bacterium]MBT7109796.1 cytochrome-c oxidase, cbb3-type subunit III [Pseudomonadota bacterium]